MESKRCREGNEPARNSYFMKQKLQVQRYRVDTGFPLTFDKTLEFQVQIDVAITVTAFSALFFHFSVEVVFFLWMQPRLFLLLCTKLKWAKISTCKCEHFLPLGYWGVHVFKLTTYSCRTHSHPRYPNAKKIHLKRKK